MTTKTACKFCGSTGVPEDLVCIRMCDWCCKNGVDRIVDRRGRLWIWLVKRVLRQLRAVRERAS
jgi:hypothetical protein